jgi:hypothetical protein
VRYDALRSILDLSGYDLDNVARWLLGNLLFGQKGFMGMFPQSVQENGPILVNRLTAPSTGQGMPMPPQAAPPPSPMPVAAPSQPSFQLPPMANIASNAPNGPECWHEQNWCAAADQWRLAANDQCRTTAKIAPRP